MNPARQTATDDLKSLNPYTRIIVDEVLRRGIHVDLLFPETVQQRGGII